MTILRLPVRFVMDCDAKPRYLGARRLSLSWTRQELCNTTDHIIQGLLLARSQIASDYCRMIAIHSRAYLLLNSVCTLIVTAMSLHSNTTLISVLRNTCNFKSPRKWTKVTRPSLAVGERCGLGTRLGKIVT